MLSPLVLFPYAVIAALGSGVAIPAPVGDGRGVALLPPCALSPYAVIAAIGSGVAITTPVGYRPDANDYRKRLHIDEPSRHATQPLQDAPHAIPLVNLQAKPLRPPTAFGRLSAARRCRRGRALRQ